MSSKPTTWSRSATIFSLYYVAPVYERYVSNEKRLMVYVPRLLEDDSFFHFEKVAGSKVNYVIKATAAKKYLAPRGSEVTLGDQRYIWIIEAFGTQDTFYMIRDSDGDKYLTAGPKELDSDHVYTTLDTQKTAPKEFIRQLFTIKALTVQSV